jgi:hypothetical protein
MPTTVEQLLPINESLRYVLYGVSVMLQIDLRASEIERMFDETRSVASSKQYEFHRSPRVVVVGTVEEYESETVLLSVQARKFDESALRRLINAAQHGSFGATWLRLGPDGAGYSMAWRDTPLDAQCSFCDKRTHVTGWMVEGTKPNQFICRACSDLIAHLFRAADVHRRDPSEG